jgi:hypothetical protein
VPVAVTSNRRFLGVTEDQLARVGLIDRQLAYVGQADRRAFEASATDGEAEP